MLNSIGTSIARTNPDRTLLNRFSAVTESVKAGPDYRYSIVIGSNRRLLWVLARTPALSPQDRAEIKDFLLKHNFPPDQLIKSADL